MRRKLTALIGTAMIVGAAYAAAAETVEEFYTGKTVTVVAPSGVGGSIYGYALLLSNHIGKHIPGNPTVVVEERAGGGGIRAANYVHNAAPDDGLVIAELHPGALIVPMTREEGYDFDGTQWLGSLAVRPYVIAVRSDYAHDRLEEITGDAQVIMASSGGGSFHKYLIYAAEISGANMNIITGYPGGGDMNLAMERGEVDGRGNYYEAFLSTNPEWIEDQWIKFLFRMGDPIPEIEDVPPLSDYVTTDEEAAMLSLLEAPLKMGAAFYVAEGVPEDRTAALRDAFSAMLADPEFIAEAEKVNLVIRPRTGEQMQAVVTDIYSRPRETAEKIDALGK